MGMWESGGESKEREEGVGTEYQAEKEVTSWWCGGNEVEYMRVKLVLACNKYFLF